MPPARKRTSISLPVTLAVSIAVLVLTAVGSALGIGLWSAARNTVDLWRDKATFVLSTTIEKIRGHLEPSRNQIEFIGRLISSGRVEPTNRNDLVNIFVGGLAAAPQVNSLIFVDRTHRALGVTRSKGSTRTFTLDLSDDSSVRSAMAQALISPTATWGEPAWYKQPKETYLNLRMGVSRDGKPLGLLVASVSVRELSTFLGSIGPAVGSNVYILHNRTRVLAHPNLEGRGVERSKENPLPRLVETGDPVLAAIWQKEGRFPLHIIKGTNLQGHALRLFGDEYLYLYRNVEGFSDKPWQIGTYLRRSDVDAELRRLFWAAAAGLGTLVLAVIAAILLGRSIARPVVDTAHAASRIGQLDIRSTPELPGSIFRELNEQAMAFNKMLRGLKWFEAYVPKKLVRRLMRLDTDGLPHSIERELTVMFTDIVGYSSMSEGEPAASVAEFLNRHFEILSECIDDSGGTVDKFIGDSVMAFWGAPDEQPDHAERAVRAALAIGQAIEAENEERQASGTVPIRLRIGLHTGPVIVGNIGAPERINYTIIGDAVNIAQRIEQLGKQIASEHEPSRSVTAIVSANTVSQVGPAFDFQALGDYPIRGRQGQVSVYRLVTSGASTTT